MKWKSIDSYCMSHTAEKFDWIFQPLWINLFNLILVLFHRNTAFTANLWSARGRLVLFHRNSVLNHALRAARGDYSCFIEIRSWGAESSQLRIINRRNMLFRHGPWLMARHYIRNNGKYGLQKHFFTNIKNCHYSSQSKIFYRRNYF